MTKPQMNTALKHKDKIVKNLTGFMREPLAQVIRMWVDGYVTESSKWRVRSYTLRLIECGSIPLLKTPNITVEQFDALDRQQQIELINKYIGIKISDGTRSCMLDNLSAFYAFLFGLTDGHIRTLRPRAYRNSTKELEDILNNILSPKQQESRTEQDARDEYINNLKEYFAWPKRGE